jgi:hypothetical protein
MPIGETTQHLRRNDLPSVFRHVFVARPANETIGPGEGVGDERVEEDPLVSGSSRVVHSDGD